MKFQSFDFLLIFLPCVLAAYYLIKNNNSRNLILIISSFIFYAWGNLWWAVILMSSAIVDFHIAKKIYELRLQDSLENADLAKKINYQCKILLILSIIFNIGLLAFFKYWDWVITSIENPLQINLEFLKHNFALPVAISFYTFESLSYTFDIYKKKWQPTKSFMDYLTFIAFFPKLVAGPIMRAHELLPQLTKLRNKVSPRNLEMGLFLIFWGLFKKLVFADNLGNIVEGCSRNSSIPGVGMLLAVAFAYQIYCDFSAYCDIARGTSKLFSINLKTNFLTPYFSRNMAEFFQRWNISLSTWIRDYVFNVMRKKSHGKINYFISLYVSMFLIGLWHGAGGFFVLYGLYMATIIALYRIFKMDKILMRLFGQKVGGSAAIVLCFLFIVFGALIFWVKSYSDFLILTKSFFAFFTLPFSGIVDENFFRIAVGVLVFSLPIFITDLIAYRCNREFVDLYPVFGVISKMGLYILMFYITLFFASRSSYDFIYFQF